MDIFFAQTALMNRTLGLIATFAQRRAQCPAQVFLATVQKSAMEFQPVRILGTSCSPLARHTMPAATRRPDSFSAVTAPDVLLDTGFAILLRIVQTGRMRELSIAKTSVNYSALLAILSSRVTIAVALTNWPSAAV